MSTNTLELQRRQAFTFDDLLAQESNVWSSLDTTYDRGLRAGKAQALREHLGVVLAAAQHQVAHRPQDREAIASFVAVLQKALTRDEEDESLPFEFDGGLGI